MNITRFRLILLAFGLAVMTFTSCKKSSTAADDSISTQDVNNITNAVNTTSDDAACAAGQVSSYKSAVSLNTAGGNLLIGATVTDTNASGNGGIVISYDGVTACNGIVRSGTVTIIRSGSTPWQNAGGVLIMTLDLTFTEQLSGYTYTLTGTHTITNETGGLAWQVVAGLANNTTVTHRIQSSNMAVTFPNGTQRTWTVDRTRSWSSNSNSSVITVNLYSEASGGVAVQGTNRFGDAFSNTFLDTVSANNSSCERWRPYSGKWQHQVSNRVATVLFGSNATGTQVGTPTYCASGDYGYYITYTNGTVTRIRFVSYW